MYRYLFFILFIVSLAPLHTAYAASVRTITVDAIDDNNPSAGCTLREAITSVNSNHGAGTQANGCTVAQAGSGNPVSYVILLPAYTYTLTGTSGDNNNVRGDLDIRTNANVSLTIIGAGMGQTIIQGASSSGTALDRVFHILRRTTTLQDLTIRYGRTSSGAGILHATSGTMTLTLSRVEVTANQSTSTGGGLDFSSGGTLVINDSLIHANSAATYGGGLRVNVTSATLTNTTLRNNTARYGGGISVNGSTTVTATASLDNVLIEGNQGAANGYGGGVYTNRANTTLTNSRILSNTMAGNRHGAAYYSAHANNIDSISATCIANNTPSTTSFHAVRDQSGTNLGATGNWWGAVNGPTPGGAGQSKNGTVDATGFLTSPPVGCPPVFADANLLDGATPLPLGATSDLGDTSIGSPLTKTYTVRNTGLNTLHLSTPIGVPAGWTVTTPFGSTTLAPNAQTTFSLRCDASEQGHFVGNVSFGTDDPDANPYQFTVVCDVAGPFAVTGLGVVAYGCTAYYPRVEFQVSINPGHYRYLAGAYMPSRGGHVMWLEWDANVTISYSGVVRAYIYERFDPTTIPGISYTPLPWVATFGSNSLPPNEEIRVFFQVWNADYGVYVAGDTVVVPNCAAP